MPHFHLEYSGNIEEAVNIGALCDVIRAEALQIDTFPLAGVRVRATRVDHYSIANGDAKHGFIDLSIRLREGRTQGMKEDAILRIFAVMKNFMAPAMESCSVALSAEIRNIDASLSPKFGNIRDHLEDSV